MRYLMTLMATLAFLAIQAALPVSAKNSPLPDPEIMGVDIHGWPEVTLYAHLDNLDSLTARDIENWQVAVDWGGRKAGFRAAKINHPSHVMLVIDNSISMKKNIKFVEQAYKIFLDGLRPNSFVSMVRFQNPTAENRWGAALLAQNSNTFYALKEIDIFATMTQRTYLYDAAYESLVFFDEFVDAGQKSIVILSDGKDIGSRTKFGDLYQRALDSGVPVYFIDFSDVKDRNRDASKISEQTAGVYAASSDPKELADIYFSILNKINRQVALRCMMGEVLLRPENAITLTIAENNRRASGSYTLNLSPERINQLQYAARLHQSDHTLRLPASARAENWGIYTDDGWFDFGTAGIGQAKWGWVDTVSTILQTSEDVYAVERGDLLTIRRLAVQEKPEAGQAYLSYYQNHYASPLVDRNLWRFVEWQIAQNKPRDAELWAQKLLDKYPWSQYADDALMFLAARARETSDDAAAEKYYLDIKQFYGESDQYGPALLALSALYVEQRHPEKAEALLLANVDKYRTLPEGGELYYQLALVQSRSLSKHNDAVRTIDRLLNLMPAAPEAPKSLLLKAEIYWKNLFLYDQAKNIYQGMLASEDYSLNIKKEAQTQYDLLLISTTPEYQLQLLEKQPTEPLLLEVMRENDWQAGRDLPDKFLTLAMSLMEAEEYDRALQITRSVANDYRVLGVRDRAMYLTAEIYAAQGKFPEQSQALTLMLDQYPGSALAIPARQNLARSYVKWGNQRDALAAYEELLLQVDESYLELETVKEEYEALKKVARVFIDGTLEGGSGQDYAQMKIVVHELPSSTVVASTRPDAAGKYKVDLLLGKQYTLIVEASGFLPATRNLDYREVMSTQNIQEELTLKLIKEGEVVTLENVLFDFGSSDLRPESYPTLDEMVRFITQNPQLQIEIAGHTDNVGDMNFNQKLSENRALRVARYILEKGASLKNVITNGYAFTRPVAGNDTEAGRSLNRRVELKVLK